MSKTGWIKETLNKGELRLTEHRNCPFCNPDRRTDVDTKLLACEEHKWVNKDWYRRTFKKT